MDIGATIKAVRKHAGLTQQQLADKVYVSRCAVAYYETNRSQPSVDKFLDILDACGCEFAVREKVNNG